MTYEVVQITPSLPTNSKLFIIKNVIEMSDENEILKENLEFQLDRLVQQLSDLEESR